MQIIYGIVDDQLLFLKGMVSLLERYKVLRYYGKPRAEQKQLTGYRSKQNKLTLCF